MQHEYMKPCEYNNILTGLIITLSGLKERRPSAGRRLLVQSIIADIEELCTMLKNEIFERVSREIWLEADEGIDYAALAEQLQTLQPVELVKSSGDEDDIIGDINRVVETLADLLFGIADALDRHHSNEDYLKLYEDQMKLFFRLRYKNSAIQSYRRWCEKDCLGSPTIEDLEEYRSVKLMNLFRTGIYKERVSSMSRGKHYDNEIVFQVPDDDKVLSQKDIHKHYYCLRKMCDYEDHQLKVIPLQVGIYFYTHRKDENAKEHRIAFLKYMTKVEMAQQQMIQDKREKKQSAQRRGSAFGNHQSNPEGQDRAEYCHPGRHLLPGEPEHHHKEQHQRCKVCRIRNPPTAAKMPAAGKNDIRNHSSKRA